MTSTGTRSHKKHSRRAEKTTRVPVLLVLDNSTASQRAVAYIASMAGGCSAFRLYLANLLPPVPPELLEFGGAENPAQEELLSRSLKADQRHWMAMIRKEAQRELTKIRGQLREAGVSAGTVLARFSDPFDRRDAADEVLDMARRHKCNTIVVGHQAHSWFRELVKTDLAEELVRRGRGFTFWIVE